MIAAVLAHVFIIALSLCILHTAVMIPEYNSYHAACVMQTWNQSYVSENLAALAVNYARMDGNAAMATGIAKYNLVSAGYCAADKTSTTATYTSAYAQLINKNSSFHVSACDELLSPLN